VIKYAAPGLLALITTASLLGCSFGGSAPVSTTAPPPEPRTILITPSGEVAAQPESPKEPFPSLTLRDVEGVEVPRARRALEPVRRQLGQCMPNQSGVVEVRIARVGGATQIAFGSGTELSTSARRCVIDILSTLNYDEQWGRSSPGDRPAGFVALLRIDF
jgi:hypothetical protein